MNLERLGTSRIWFTKFQTQYEMTATMLRPQECCECPNKKFRNHIFNMEEYADWYANKYGNFTYYSDWHGFNLPVKYVFKLYNEFPDLSNKERKLIESVFECGAKQEDYLITCFVEDGTFSATMSHEIAHGLFCTDKKYRKEVKKILKTISDTKIDKLKQVMKEQGYCPSVYLDEIHAYLMGDYRICPIFNKFLNKKQLNSLVPIQEELKKQLKNCADEYNIDICV